MKSKLIVFLAVCFAAAACQKASAPANNSAGATPAPAANTSPAAETVKKTAPTDLQQLAQRIVNQSAAVKEGEIVMINGSARDMELLENLVTEVQKVGGNPLLSISSDRMTKRSYTDVDPKFDSKPPKLGLALTKIANVTINMDSGDTEGLLADIPPARLAERGKTFEPLTAESAKNKVRNVNIGNDLYPTEWRAKRFEMPLDNFAKLFWDGVNIEYTGLEAAGEKARAALTGKEVEITHPNGTNLKVNIESKPAYISDGIISAEDVQKGSLDVFLPAGEAAVITAPNSGTGKFIVEKDYFQGKEIKNLTMNFENGKMTSMTGEGDGFALLKADYDANGAGKDVLSYLDIGINPNYVLAPTSKLGNWVSAGMVSVGTGNNTWAGGNNSVSYGAGGHLAGCTVKVDGKTIVENGKLMF
jgi:leucyl aminopeptidase (aminopeptidase T)